MGKSSSGAVGLDTSVVMRLLTGEPEAQAEYALRLVGELNSLGRKAMVSDRVVAEACFALHFHYDVPKREAMEALLDLLRSPSVEGEPGGSAVGVFEAMLDGPGKPGLVDRLIHAQYARVDARTASFERASQKLADSIFLKA